MTKIIDRVLVVFYLAGMAYSQDTEYGLAVSTNVERINDLEKRYEWSVRPVRGPR